MTMVNFLYWYFRSCMLICKYNVYHSHTYLNGNLLQETYEFIQVIAHRVIENHVSSNNMVIEEACHHDDVIKWKHFPRYCPFVPGIHRSPVNSTHKGQWRGALMFSLIWAWINGWVNNREAGDLRRHRAHYDVIVMTFNKWYAVYVDPMCMWSLTKGLFYWHGSIQAWITYYINLG